MILVLLLVRFLFQSTLPLRGATQSDPLPNPYTFISIHAPLTGSDRYFNAAVWSHLHFNPRSPYGERPPITPHGASSSRFQSTLPLRGATMTKTTQNPKEYISIHAPLTGSDRLREMHRTIKRNFNPRSPYGERQVYTTYENQRTISIHAPLTGSDNRDTSTEYHNHISIHAPLTGSDFQEAESL